MWQGWFVRKRLKHYIAFSCYLAPQIVGLGEAPKEAWKRYVGWQMSTEEAAKKAYEAVPKLKPGEYSGVLISPWEWCPVEPDVVIFFGNASQILIIVAAYIYDKGGTLSFSANGIGTLRGGNNSPSKGKQT